MSVNKYDGFWHALVVIFKEEGFAGYYNGKGRVFARLQSDGHCEPAVHVSLFPDLLVE